MNQLKTYFLALCMALPLLASAAETKSETVNELLKVTHFDQLINESINASIDNLKKMLPGLANHEEELRAFYVQTMNPDLLRQDAIQIYSEVFTEQELKDLIAFYKTPTGQKALQKLPEIMQRSMQLAQERLMKNQGELFKLLEKVAKDPATQEAQKAAASEAREPALQPN